MPTTRDYYEILGVKRDTSAEDIKRAYRRLAMKHHPDRNHNDPDAEAAFRECAEAYEILADSEKRANYDRYGSAGLRGTAGHDFRSMNVEDIFSMFDDIFGGLGGFQRGRTQRGVPRGYDLEYEVEVELDEVLTGTSRDVEFRRQDVCSICAGSGAKPGTEPITCSTCQGQGQVARVGGLFRMIAPCPHCQGRGKVVVDKCADCRGCGRTSLKRKLAVKIPAGIRHGQAVRLQGEGEPPPPELDPAGRGIRGDLQVVVRVLPHAHFERDGDHLLLAMPVAFSQLALGATIPVPTLAGTTAALTLPPGTQHGGIFRIRSEGVPNLRSGDRGDLVVVVQLVVPKRLDEQQRSLLTKYAEAEEVEVGSGDKASLWTRLIDKVTGG